MESQGKRLSGIPLLLLITGAILGTYLAGKFTRSSDAMSALFGMGGLIVGILFLFRKRGAKKGYMPVIVEVIQ
jgi:hypothetical protein